MTAPGAPTVPPSPAPLTPSGLVGLGTSRLVTDVDLRAEAAADVADPAAHPLGRDAEDAGEVGGQLMHALQRGVEGVAPGPGLPLGERHPRLHEAGDESVVDQREARDVSSA